MRVIVTGGSGLLGKYVINAVLARGHNVLNLDLHLPQEDWSVHTIRTDLTDSGQVLNGLTSPFRIGEPFDESLPTRPDAVIHLAGIARNMIVPDNELFRTNTCATYNVVEVACKLGVPKIVVASSITVYGVTFANGVVDYPSFPVDEEVDCHPMDPYAISKLCGERIARGFARKYGNDIYILRIGAVLTPLECPTKLEQYRSRPSEGLARAHGWSYSDAEDMGVMFECTLRRDGLGYQVFNATSNGTTIDAKDVNTFLATACPNTPFTRRMGPKEAPITNLKARELLGFQGKHRWQGRSSKSHL